MEDRCNAEKIHFIAYSKITQLLNLGTGLKAFQQNGKWCDVAIKVENTTFHAHRVVLASTCDYFATMFTSGFQESNEHDVQLTGTAEAFKVVLKYLYTGDLDLPDMPVLAMDLLKMSHYLQLQYVFKRCQDHLRLVVSNKRPSSIVTLVREVLQIVCATELDVYGLPELKDACLECLMKNFKEVKSSEMFISNVTFDLMVKILDHNDLEGVSEKEVFDTLIAWLYHDWDQRKDHAPTLLQKIRLGAVPLSHLTMKMLNSTDFYNMPECKQTIDHVMGLIDNKKADDPPLSVSYPTMFCPRTTIDAFVSIDVNDTKYYSTKEKKWMDLPQFPKLLSPGNRNSRLRSSVDANGQLFILQGVKDQPFNFFTLDSASRCWISLALVPFNHLNFSLVALNHNIYAICGPEAQHQHQQHVYNIKKNTWTTIKSMPHLYRMKSSCQCIAYKDKIIVYATPINNMNSGEIYPHHLLMYDPLSDTWSVLMTERHPLARSSTYDPSIASGLVMHDDKCYRIIDADCRCHSPDCPWHVLNVHQLSIDVETKTASVAQRQNQTLIPNRFKTVYREAFCIGEDVYMICKGRHLKTGIKTTQNQEQQVDLAAWEKLSGLMGWFNRSYEPKFVVSYRFDKVLFT